MNFQTQAEWLAELRAKNNGKLEIKDLPHPDLMSGLSSAFVFW